MNELKLHDIKPLAQIPDISLYLLLAIITVAIIVLCMLFIILFQAFKNRAKNERKVYLKALKEVNLNNSKEAAYLITKNLRALMQTEHEKKLIEELIVELEGYKYKKEVKAFDQKTKDHFERVMNALD